MSQNLMPLPACSQLSNASGNVAKSSGIQKNTNVMTIKESPFWSSLGVTTFVANDGDFQLCDIPAGPRPTCL